MKTKISLWLLAALMTSSSSAGILDTIDDTFMEFYAGIRASCERIMTAARNSRAQKELIDSVKNGEAKKIRLLSETNPGLALHMQIDGLVMGRKYDYEYCRRMLRSGDQLYAFAGKFFRYREKDDTIFVIPEIFEQQMEAVGLLSGRDILEIHATFPEKYLFPNHPLLAQFKSEFSGPYSEWETRRGQLIYRVQLRALHGGRQAGYFDLSIVFKRNGTVQLSVSPRTQHPADHIYEDMRNSMIVALSTTDLALLFATANSEIPLRLNSDQELAAQLEILHKHQYELRVQY